MRFRRPIALLLAVLAVVASGCASYEGLTDAELYDAACGRCHGAEGRGGRGPALGPGSDAVGLTDEQISNVIAIGPGSMPGFGRSLTDAQIASLVEHIRRLQTAP